MKIALINENSQAAKKWHHRSRPEEGGGAHGPEVVNYGMYAADDAAQLTYVQCGILAAILLNSGAADYVVTGCGTGEGAMLALNSFPGVICGHVEDPVGRLHLCPCQRRQRRCHALCQGLRLGRRAESRVLL